MVPPFFRAGTSRNRLRALFQLEYRTLRQGSQRPVAGVWTSPSVSGRRYCASRRALPLPPNRRCAYRGRLACRRAAD